MALETPIWKNISLRGRMILALMGALLLGVPIPCLLTWWSTNGAPLHRLALDKPNEYVPWQLQDLLVLLIFCSVLCGTFALGLGGIMMASLRGDSRLEQDDERFILSYGMKAGAGLAFLNLPGYFAKFFYGDGALPLVRIVMLFAVTGLTCGAWIAWQAYKERHPQRGFLPRFSLKTLVLLSLGWGLLLMLYRPE